MYYYQVLPEQRLPAKFLTYSCKEEIPRGQVVKIDIRGKLRWGVAAAPLESDKVSDREKIKGIVEILPTVLSQTQLNFLFSFAYNTFNSPSGVLGAMLNPLQSLAKKYWGQIQPGTPSGQEPSKKPLRPGLDFAGGDISIRIRYIIRSIFGGDENGKGAQGKDANGPVMVVFPEKKRLFAALSEIEGDLDKDYEIDIYAAEKTAASQKTVVNVLNSAARIIFATRQGLFLPWPRLRHIILVDEANSFYIQDQNQLYYDAREASFLLAQHFGAGLTFLSTLPSVRLYNFNSEEVLRYLTDDEPLKGQDGLNIRLIKRERKREQFDDLLEVLDLSDSIVVEEESQL